MAEPTPDEREWLQRLVTDPNYKSIKRAIEDNYTERIKSEQTDEKVLEAHRELWAFFRLTRQMENWAHGR